MAAAHKVPAADDREFPLGGGIANAGLVVRVGDTVRRPARPTSASTAALLEHLDAVGFDGAPRFLGFDDRGREVLSFVPGQALIPPYPSWAMTDAALISCAHLLRRYHEAVASFDPRPYVWPASPPDPFVAGIVSHNDPNLDNVVFRDGAAVALIDFDLASPGSALWDVAGAARLWAPLRTPGDISDDRLGSSFRRLRTFVRGYGVPTGEYELLAQAVVLHHDWIYEIVRTGAERGNRGGYAHYWYHGGEERADRSREWLRRHAAAIEAALRAR